MAILNLGSINIDHVYTVPYLPGPGETLASSSVTKGLGGKGANQSIAAARAGAEIWHLGAVGPDSAWCIDELAEAGVKTEFIDTLDIPTGHAIINVDTEGENAIVLYKGANWALEPDAFSTASEQFTPGNWLLFQNETNLTAYMARMAKASGMKVAYAAAPFSADAVIEVLEMIDLLAVNEVEAAQLAKALNVSPTALPVPQVLITKGAAGAEFHEDGDVVSVPAFPVEPVDTTGAGDTFLGFFLAGLDQGSSTKDALLFASAAAALQVTKTGAAKAIPERDEVQAYLRMM